MNMPRNAWFYSAMMPLIVLMNPVGALAAPDPAPAVDEVQEIIVTAQRRKERLQDVPIVVNAFGGDQLEAAGIKSTLNDIEQVEVLKGPQGTLFGRNATGGLIQITTKDPTQKFDGYVEAGYGSYNTAAGDLYVGGGVAQSVAADLSVHYQDQGTGFGRNAFTNTEVNKTKDLSVRSKWVFAPGDATSIKVIFDYSHQNFAQAYVPAPGTRPPGDVAYTGDPP